MLNLIKEDYVRCVWPGAVLPLGKNGKYLVNFFKEKYAINIDYLKEAKTLPGRRKEGTRIDQIFNVKDDSKDKFAEIKSRIGALYATEIVQKGEHHLYNERTYYSYFKRTEDDLLKAGDISKEDVYQTID